MPGSVVLTLGFDVNNQYLKGIWVLSFQAF
ncbi:Uncharacterised protein [Klebsiella pneumoniae]|nr:Uncharacterised protein [Klebsiella pneumoniae]SVP40502.1 Uncharacterised protein [Klebsiella pneumoniae]